jgi:DNA polymerase I-like protein with 3'-5' exonuclease and polymerase domains
MIIREASHLKLALEMLETSDTWSTDVETTGLSPRKDKLIGFGCATPDTLTGFYIIMREWRDGTLVDVLTEEQVKPVLEMLATKKLLGWNFAFDAAFILRQTGINLMPAIHCEVMLVVHCVDENRFQYGLKQISAEIFGEKVVGEQSDLKESIKANGGSVKEFYKGSGDIVAAYGLQDNILTCRNYLYWLPKLEAEGLTKFYFEDEVLPLYKEVTFYLQYHGVPVDMPLLLKTREEIALKISEYEDRIQAAIKPLLGPFHKWYIEKKYPFKMSGPFLQALAVKLAPEGWPRTDKGAYSFNKVDLARAQKKGLLALDTQLERYVVTKLDRIPEALIHEVQLELLAAEGTKYPFNLNSKDFLKRLFFGTSTTPSLLNEEPISKTDLGSPQVDSEFLDVMAKKYEWAEWLRIYNKLQKISGSYVERFIEESEDGIFYPAYYQHRTVSGRYGSDFQQLSRPMEPGEDHDDVIEFNNRIRRFFIAPPEHVIVDDDFESLEPHIFAHVANDPALLEIFNNGHDFYSTVAIRTERLHQYSADKSAENYLGKLNKLKRQQAKAYALGTAYGMTGFKLKFELDISQSEAEQLIKDYLRAFPELDKMMKESRAFALLNGYVRVESGRKRRFPRLRALYAKYGNVLFDSLELWKQYNDMPALYKQAKEDAAYVKNAVNNSINVKIQGLASSIVNRACIAIAREFATRGINARICAQIHDQITCFAHTTCVEEVKEIMQRNMENIYPLRLKLKAVPSVGMNMAESKG